MTRSNRLTEIEKSTDFAFHVGPRNDALGQVQAIPSVAAVIFKHQGSSEEKPLVGGKRKAESVTVIMTALINNEPGFPSIWA